MGTGGGVVCICAARLAFEAIESAGLGETLNRQYRGAFEMLLAPSVRRAFDLRAEPEPVRERYGRTKIGQLWAYARDLFQTPGFGDTVDFDHIKRHYYMTHDRINPTRIVPKGPDPAIWYEPHGRG